MEKELILVVGATIGATIGALGTYFAAVVGRRIDAAKKDAVLAAMEVASYHRLERLYAEIVAKQNNESYRVVLNKMRSIVELEGLLRPTMTTRKANELIKRWK